MSKLGLAIAITAEAFKHTIDRGGQPYILHCLEVMRKTEGDDDVKCAAVLHDILEDTNDSSSINYTVKLLLELGFSMKTVRLVDTLSKRPDETYDQFIKRISLDKEASRIKLSDIEHNSKITRLKGLTKKDFDRMEKYHKAYVNLSKLKT